MYRCTECNTLFEEPAFYIDDPSPPGIALPPGYYTYDICPYCASEYIEEVADEEDEWEEDWDKDEI